MSFRPDVRVVALPDVLRRHDRTVRTRAQWEAGRLELLNDFASEIYGAPVPVDPAAVSSNLCLSPATDRTAPCVLLLAPGLPADVLADPDGRWGRGAVLERGWSYAAITPSTVVADDSASLERLTPSTTPAPGVLSAWASVVSAVLDQLFEAGLGRRGLALVGQSRLGKAALLAAARDERISALVVSQSGLAGVAPIRETVPARTKPRETAMAAFEKFPHWFTPRFRTYVDDPSALPVDQHQLLALCAPRPVLVFNAEEDAWVDPPGQLNALAAARGVWDLWSNPLSPVAATRAGGHGIAPGDWPVWLNQLQTWWSECRTPSGRWAK